MVAALVSLLVNGSPFNSINNNSFCITYDRANGLIYQAGIPAVSAAGKELLTKFDATTGTRLASQQLDTSMGISGNTSIRPSTMGYQQIVTSANGDGLFACTTGGATRLISKWSPTTLLEVATFSPSFAINNLSNHPMVSFTLDGVNYMAFLYNTTVRICVFNTDTMALVVDTTSGSAAPDIYGLLVGEKPTATTQALYILNGADGGLRVAIQRVVFNKGTGTISSSSEIARWRCTDFDSHWDEDFGKGVQAYIPMFDHTDNTIIWVAGRLGGSQLSGATTDGYIVKVSSSAKTMLWQVATPNNYHWSNTSAPAIIEAGVLRFMPGPTTNIGGTFTYPWTEPDGSSGPLLLFDTSDGSYDIEYYSYFGRTGSNAQRANIWLEAIDTILFYDVNGVNLNGQGWYGVLFTTPDVPEVLFPRLAEPYVADAIPRGLQFEFFVPIVPFVPPPTPPSECPAIDEGPFPTEATACIGQGMTEIFPLWSRIDEGPFAAAVCEAMGEDDPVVASVGSCPCP